MKFMRKLLSILFVLFIGGAVFAQSADVVTEILSTDEVTYGQVCYLSAIHQNLISEDAGYEEAVKVLNANGQFTQNVSAGDVISKADLAFIYVQLWPDMKASLMYKLTKGSARYAFKQLKNDGIFSDKEDPMESLSGADALNVLTACMLEYGTDECMEMYIEE